MKRQDDFDEFLIGLGRTVRKYRTQLGMTQEQLAKAIGSESEKDMRSYISKLESGHRNPPASVLKRISVALNVPVFTLLDEAENVQKEIQLCDLFSLCHWGEAYTMVQQFLKLDQADRLVIYGRILGMLDAEKYTSKKGIVSLNA